MHSFYCAAKSLHVRKHNPQISVTCPASPMESVARPELNKQLSSILSYVQALKFEFLSQKKAQGLKRSTMEVLEMGQFGLNEGDLGLILLCLPCRSAQSHVCLVCSSHQGLWIHSGRLEICEGSCEMKTFSRVQDSPSPRLWRAAQPCKGYNKRLWNFHLYLGWF